MHACLYIERKVKAREAFSSLRSEIESTASWEFIDCIGKMLLL